jgi:multidrug resistance efflux pump
MANPRILDLADCREFRQTLMARPPRVVHGAVTLLAALVAAALGWAALAQADLVVRAAGRVRPVTTPEKVVNAGRGELLSGSSGGRVVAVNVREGDEVKAGDVLVRLDTQRLDNEIARRQGVIRSAEEELARNARLEGLSAQQFEAARDKAAAELAQAEDDVRRARERQAVEVRLARVELEAARDDEARVRKLTAGRAASEADLVKATARVGEAAEKLARARLPVEEGKVEVARRALALVDKDYALRRAELEIKRGVKQGEVEAARLELANLELERRQAVLRSPVDGVVTRGDVKVGDVLESGKTVVEIAEQRGFRFETEVPSEEVSHLRPGLPARIRLDAYDSQKYGTLAGTVAYISPDSGVAEGRRTTYTVRIDVEGEELRRGELRGRVKLGMAGYAEIVTGRESLLGLFLKTIRRTISLG